MPKYHTVPNFYEDIEPSLAELAHLIRATVLASDPQLREALKYNTPFFIRKSWVCYLGQIKKDKGIEVCFPRGPELSNEHGLLDRKNRAAMSGMTFLSVDDYLTKEEAFLNTLQEALLLDDIMPKSAAAEILSGKYRK